MTTTQKQELKRQQRELQARARAQKIRRRDGLHAREPDAWGVEGNLPNTGPDPPTLTAQELERILSMAEASATSSLSIPTLRRRYRRLIIKLSPGRCGMRLRDVLAIGEQSAE